MDHKIKFKCGRIEYTDNVMYFAVDTKRVKTLYCPKCGGQEKVESVKNDKNDNNEK